MKKILIMCREHIPGDRKQHMGAFTNPQLIYTASGNPSNPPLIMIHGWGSHRDA